MLQNILIKTRRPLAWCYQMFLDPKPFWLFGFLVWTTMLIIYIYTLYIFTICLRDFGLSLPNYIICFKKTTFIYLNLKKKGVPYSDFLTTPTQWHAMSNISLFFPVALRGLRFWAKVFDRTQKDDPWKNAPQRFWARQWVSSVITTGYSRLLAHCFVELPSFWRAKQHRKLGYIR